MMNEMERNWEVAEKRELATTDRDLSIVGSRGIVGTTDTAAAPGIMGSLWHFEEAGQAFEGI